MALPSGRAARVPAKERGRVAVRHARECRMKKKSISVASSHTSDAANHLKRDVLVAAVRLGFVNFHASGTSLEAAALFAVKESGVLTFPSAIVSLWTEVALCVQAHAGPAVATRGSSRRLGSYCSIVGLGMFSFP
jgi:hypothetical protein